MLEKDHEEEAVQQQGEIKPQEDSSSFEEGHHILLGFCGQGHQQEGKSPYFLV